MKIKFFIILIIVIITLTSCSSAQTTNDSYAMGTFVSQSVYASHQANADAAIKEALEAITALEKIISYKDPESELYRLNETGGIEVSEKLGRVLLICNQLSENSDGAYDSSILPIIKLWGFDSEDKKLPDNKDIKDELEKVDYNNIVIEKKEDGITRLTLINGASVDLSACGKGAACDEAVAVYKYAGINGAVVSVGGSIGIYGAKDGRDFEIGVRDPFGNGIIGTLALSNTFVSTSGSYENSFEYENKLYHHLLDPKTGYPSDSGLVSVTVVCSSGILSDALSSACFILGEERSYSLLKKYSAEAVFIKNNGTVIVTDGLSEKWTKE